MITYAIAVTRGCIHSFGMEITIGTTVVTLECAPLRNFIEAANETNLESVLGTVPEGQHELLTFIYEEFKDTL